jgi:hypothetical protein
MLEASPFGAYMARLPERQEVDLRHVLHYVALAVQFISLAIQSYVRKSLGDPEFVFVDPPLNEISLEGIKPNYPDRIVATSQRLSCMGEMVSKKVLVFGSRPIRNRSDDVKDVRSTLADLDELWGPIQLITKVSCSQFMVSFAHFSIVTA